MRRSRLISYLGQVVIDTMVGLDKDSSSESISSMTPKPSQEKTNRACKALD